MAWCRHRHTPVRHSARVRTKERLDGGAVATRLEKQKGMVGARGVKSEKGEESKVEC